MKTAVEEYLEFVRTRPTLDALYERLLRLANEFGFQFIAYTVLRPPKTRSVSGFVTKYQDGATTRTNYGEDWISHYDLENYYFVDPILQRTPMEHLPFRWSDVAEGVELNRKQHKMLSEARDAGMVSGVTIPLHGPNEGISALNLAGEIPERELGRLWGEFKADLFTAAIFTHDLVLAEAMAPNPLADVRLGPRERECLLWTAQGKTTWEISQILSISEDTVRSYLRGASEKLGVNSKHHAAIKAVTAGLINPD